MRTTFAAIATAAGLTLALSGCTESEPREPEPSWTPSSTPEQPSTTPAANDSLTVAPEGETARQFIRRWVAVSNHAQRTGDVAPYESITTAGCKSCARFAERISAVYAAGGYIHTKGDRVVRMEHDGGPQWTVGLLAAPTTYSETRDSAERRLPGGEHKKRLFLRRLDGQWKIAEILEPRT